MQIEFGRGLKQSLENGNVLPFIGVYDVFSASIAARYYDGIFLSGFSFAASYYGLPDIGFIAWSDIISLAQRVRTLLPSAHLLVDIDDGYADVEVACHVVSVLESMGVSGVILEDQKRPRRCGHYDGKCLMDLSEFLVKLKQVLATRRDIFVIARTDAADLDEIMRRATAFAEAGADAILVDAIRDVSLIGALKAQVPQPLVFNQIAGGRSPRLSLTELKEAGASIVIYSTPCLFAAQAAVDDSMRALRENDGKLPDPANQQVGVGTCTALLTDNLAGRDRR
jgi:2-methylisocitrate lyase-like PEP mutase family enzyme